MPPRLISFIYDPCGQLWGKSPSSVPSNKWFAGVPTHGQANSHPPTAQTLKSIMGGRHPLANPALEQTIDKIITKTEKEIASGIDSALADSHKALDDAVPRLEQEYDRILADGRKEADKITKQITGGSDLEARNAQLLALEDAVDRVFERALKQVADAPRDAKYSALTKSLLAESVKVLGTSNVVVYASQRDGEVVKSLLAGHPGSEMAPSSIECLGGVRVQSKDGTMTFDNTIDARIERMKPLIRKEIAAKFGVSS